MNKLRQRVFAAMALSAGEWADRVGTRCVVACSDRQTIEEIVNGQTHKKVIFEFVRWRKI